MEGDNKSEGRKDIQNFVSTNIHSIGTKIILIGSFQNEMERNAWKAENVKTEGLQLTLDFQNNQYSQYLSEIQSSLMVHVIHPATEKDLRKYDSFNYFVVTENRDLYENVTKKFIDNRDQNGEKWIIDILERKAETERNILIDEHPENGFILSTSWGSGKELKDVHLLAMVNRRDLRTIRDLNRTHLPLLYNVKNQMEKYFKDSYNCDTSKFFLFFHYQPTYYHLHIHGCYADQNSTDAGLFINKGRLLNEVIDNIEIFDDFYQKATLTYSLNENSPLLCQINEFRKIKSNNNNSVSLDI